MITLSKQHLLAGGLVVLNLLVLTPTAFVASHLWTETKEWRTDTDSEIREVKSELNQLEKHIPEQYATKDTLKEVYGSIQKSIDRINVRLTHMK